MNEILIKELENLVLMRNKVREEERRLKNELLNLERKAFNGLTYREYIQTLDVEEKRENVEVKVSTYNIYAKYKLTDGIYLDATSTVYEGSLNKIKVVYPTKTLTDVPKKYAKEEEHIRRIIEDYKVVNPSKKYAAEYRLEYV